MQIYTVTVACAYNILIILSLSSLYWLSPPSLSHFIRLRRTALSFSHLINLACSSFCWSPRSKSSPLPTRSSKLSRQTSLLPTTWTEFYDGETWGFVLSAEEHKLDHHVDEDEDLDAKEHLSLSLISSIFGGFLVFLLGFFFYWFSLGSDVIEGRKRRSWERWWLCGLCWLCERDESVKEMNILFE